MMITVEQVIRLAALFSGIYAVYSGLEYLSIRQAFDEDGIFSWKIVESSFNRRSTQLLKPFLSRFSLVLAMRIVIGAMLVLSVVLAELSLSASFAVLAPVFVLFLIFSDVLILLRFTGGLSGASHMSMVVNGGLLFVVAFPGNETVRDLALLFIALQGILSYFVAGIAKIIGSSWRNGEAMAAIFSTQGWGDDRVFGLIQSYPPLKLVGSWSVMGFELLFPVVLVLDPKFLPVVFAIAIVSHLCNAVFMGINGFIYVFPGTYPAIYYVNETGAIQRLAGELWALL